MTWANSLIKLVIYTYPSPILGFYQRMEMGKRTHFPKSQVVFPNVG